MPDTIKPKMAEKVSTIGTQQSVIPCSPWPDMQRLSNLHNGKKYYAGFWQSGLSVIASDLTRAVEQAGRPSPQWRPGRPLAASPDWYSFMREVKQTEPMPHRRPLFGGEKSEFAQGLSMTGLDGERGQAHMNCYPVIDKCSLCSSKSWIAWLELLVLFSFA